MFKRLLAVAAGVLLTFAGAVVAADLRADHPTTYVVQKGDTLWDIAGKFLGEPWLWPEIWQANPQVESPHRIYPGDVLSLVYVDGQPRIAASGPSDGPRVGEAINTVPLSQIEPFLKQFTIVEDVESLPYVVSLEDGRLYSSAGQLVYVRGLAGAEPGMMVDLARPVNQFGGGNRRVGPGFSALDFRGEVNHNHWGVPEEFNEAAGEILGYEMLVHASGEVTNVQGDITSIVLRDEGREIRIGDRVLMPEAQPYDLHFIPRAADPVPTHGRILAVADGVTAGPRVVVALNVGARDGIRNGNVFSVWDENLGHEDRVADRLSAVEDTYGDLELPDEFLGHLMVFRTFDKVSYALVMSGIKPISQGDVLKHPDAAQ